MGRQNASEEKAAKNVASSLIKNRSLKYLLEVESTRKAGRENGSGETLETSYFI